MKNKNKIVLGTAGALVLGLLVGTYFLSGLNKTSLAQNIQTACSNQDFQAVQSAIENKDYNAWVELKQKYTDQRLGKGAKWDELIDSQKKFEKFTDMKQLMEDGKFEEVQVIRQELGFPIGPGMGKGMGQGRLHN